MKQNSNKKLFIVCTGLGSVKRGFETYIEDLANMLTVDMDLPAQISVYSGAIFTFKNFKSNKVFSISRNNKIIQFFVRDIYKLFEIEQLSFFLSFSLELFFNRPKLIYLGEYKLYCYLFKLRQLFSFKYSLVLYTGGQAYPGLFNPKLDFVHHITDVYYNKSLESTQRVSREFLVPHFIDTKCEIDNGIYTSLMKQAKGKKIILSVGSLDNKVKRLGVLINCLAPIKSEVFPIFLGDNTTETNDIKSKLELVFGSNNFIITRADRRELAAYYSAAAVLISFSLHESFGLVNLEALLWGTPVICHNYAEASFVLGKTTPLYDLNNFSHQLPDWIKPYSSEIKYPALRQFVLENYEKNKLYTAYYNMFKHFLNN